MDITNRDVAAIIATYNPNIERFRSVIKALINQVSTMVVVDNGSKNKKDIEILLKNFQNIAFIPLRENLGLAAALNIGVEKIRKTKYRYKWILTLDQDSIIFKNAVSTIITDFNKLPDNIKNRVGIISLSPSSRETRDISYLLQTHPIKNNKDFIDADFIITSGNLVKYEIFDYVKYREDLFIDDIDYEFDIRLRSLGYKLLEHNYKLMDHQGGIPIIVDGKVIKYHNELRIYYCARNGIFIVTRYFGFIFIHFLNLIGLSFGYLLVLCYRYIKVNGLLSFYKCFRALILGFVDGIIGNLGKTKRQI